MAFLSAAEGEALWPVDGGGFCANAVPAPTASDKSNAQKRDFMVKSFPCTFRFAGLKPGRQYARSVLFGLEHNPITLNRIALQLLSGA